MLLGLQKKKTALRYSGDLFTISLEYILILKIKKSCSTFTRDFSDDADWLGDKDGRISVRSFEVYLDNNLVPWSAYKQYLVKG